MSPSVYGIAKPVVAVSLSLICNWEVRNKIDVMPQGPVIVASNHLSWIDIPLLAIVVPRRIAYMAKKEYFHSTFHRVLLQIFGGFTVERGMVDRTALDQADEALRNGCALGMFPEGTRSRSFELQRGRLGLAYVALRNDAFVLPIGISGTEKIRHKYENKARFFSRPQVTLNMGKPFKLPRVEGTPTRAELAASTETVMRRLAELLPEGYRGVYKDNDVHQ